MKNKRRNHSAQFKAKVALTVAKGGTELANNFNVHPKPDCSMEEAVIKIAAGVVFITLGRRTSKSTMI